ncbi:MAG: prolyl oligopeptidase family serine peptidase [Planctomycetia bacterium]|nr:prolyl oligopeptidase family serine peptidase [Planctomycetia bacterium]
MMPFLMFMAASMAQTDSQLSAGDHTRKITVDGRERTYLVHVPRKIDASKPAPVVLAFHGGGSNAEQMVRFCGLDEKADDAGFIVVYPSGSGRTEQLLTWNAGNCCGYAQHEKIGDVAFVRQLLDDLARVVRVDADRVFATGMSNGGMMAYLLASDLSDRIAAIAPVGGPMGTNECHPKRAVPVMHFHGADDKFAPLAGGRGERSLSQTNFLSVEHSVGCWIKANECQAKPAVVELPVQIEDGTKVTRKTWGGGKDGSEVILFEIAGAGHTWPGRKPPLLYLGKSTKNISANDAMWEFFQRHPRR